MKRFFVGLDWFLVVSVPVVAALHVLTGGWEPLLWMLNGAGFSSALADIAKRRREGRP